jgi:hypothetical protein
MVIVGNNPLSSDVVGARLLGYKPQAINYLYKLSNLGIKEADINKINLFGLSINEAESLFSKSIYKQEYNVAS